MEWHVAIGAAAPYVVRISTPQGSGTGWLVSRSKGNPSLCGIATAAHVIDHAHYWEEPIRLHHSTSGKSVLLRSAQRSVLLDEGLDSAAIVFASTDELPLPTNVPVLIGKDKHVKPGVEVGWLGFPAIPRADLCFFSGHVSAFLDDMAAYLVDGVAINGVSGGPAFYVRFDKEAMTEGVVFMGIVSAYIPNRATGEVLPGVAVVRDATQFHDLVERFRSFDEAKDKETPPQEKPPATETKPAEIPSSKAGR